MIFDEVVTGFRLDMGGAQKLYNIMPDITVLRGRLSRTVIRHRAPWPAAKMS